MRQPTISVLLPSLDQAEFLPEAIESVLEQDFADFEFVIADAGSADASRAVIARYAAGDARIRVCPPEGNPGLAGNWNHCLAQARGRFVKFMFGDDRFVSRAALRQLLEAFAERPAVVLATSAVQLVDAQSRPLAVRRSFPRAGVYPGPELALRCLQQLSNFVGEPSVVMFRAAAAGAGFNPRYRHLVDLEFWLRLLAAGDLAFVAEPLTAFRTHAGQLTARNVAAGTDAVEARWLLRDALEHPTVGPRLTRRHLFRALYTLRKHPLPASAADGLETELRCRIGPNCYRALWLHHKVTRPLANLGRWLGCGTGQTVAPLSFSQG